MLEADTWDKATFEMSRRRMEPTAMGRTPPLSFKERDECGSKRKGGAAAGRRP